MARDSERSVGTALIALGTLTLLLPCLLYRRGHRVPALLLGLVVVLPGVLAVSAGRKLRVHPPRREITLGDLYENVWWYRLWRRLGLV